MAHFIHIRLPPPPIHPNACRSLDAGHGERTSPVPSSGCLAPVVLPLVSVVCVPTKSNGSSLLVCKFSLWEPAGTSQCSSVRCESLFDCVGDQPIIQLRLPAALTVALSKTDTCLCRYLPRNVSELGPSIHIPASGIADRSLSRCRSGVGVCQDWLPTPNAD